MNNARSETTEASQTETAAKAGSVPVAGVLAWLMPGLGHWYLGLRRRALILFVVTTVTFWAGVAVGGVKSTVAPNRNGPWFAAQLCMGAQTAVAWAGGRYIAKNHVGDIHYEAFWPSDNIAVVYTGIAGLLNLLIIIDALARAENAGAPISATQRPPPQRRRS
jgi:hypothetical protein